MTMRKTILSVLGASAVALLTAQTAIAAEQHHARKTDRATATEQFRNSNAYAAPANIAVQQDWSRYSTGGGMSAPAGR
jgi:outer membrane biogenesis lipoprotein LolB